MPVRPSAGKNSQTRQRLSGGNRSRGSREHIKAGAEAAGNASAVCPSCKAVYINKNWVSQFRVPANIRVSALPKVLCNECRIEEQKSGFFAGEVVIEGVKDKSLLAEIVNLIENVGRRAESRDPEERIIKIERSAGKVRVLTSENQLAVSIGKQLDSSRKGGKLSIAWSRGDKLVRVRWQAGE